MFTKHNADFAAWCLKESPDTAERVISAEVIHEPGAEDHRTVLGLKVDDKYARNCAVQVTYRSVQSEGQAVTKTVGSLDELHTLSKELKKKPVKA